MLLLSSPRLWVPTLAFFAGWKMWGQTRPVCPHISSDWSFLDRRMPAQIRKGIGARSRRGLADFVCA